MTRISIKLALILLACISIIYLVAPAPAYASSTQIKVEVLPGGDARWTTEKMIPLETAGDVAGWDATAAQGTDNYKADFTGRMNDYVARISATLGRPMTVKDVSVTVEKAHPYALSDSGTTTYGVISYEFTWTGFSMVSGDALEIGDAFTDGFMLNKDDTITFVLPSDYGIMGISPASDDLKRASMPQVKWTGSSNNNTGTGVRLFSSGEPSIILRKVATPGTSFDWWMLLPIVLASAAIGFGAAFLLQRMRTKPGPIETPIIPDRLATQDGQCIPDAGVELPHELGDGRYMSDEEKVLLFLEEAGGQMFQSDLVKKTDFSKSKLSMVLSQLKEQGTILKIKKGKENLIRWNRPSDDPPAEDDDEGAP